MPLFHIIREEKQIYYLTVETNDQNEALLEAEKDFGYHSANEIKPDKIDVRYMAQKVVNLDEL